LSKTQPLDDSGVPYSTEISNFNGRDQVESVKVYPGAEEPGGSCPISTNSYDGCQLDTIEYDGFGRPWRTHRPEQNINTYTTTLYNDDNTISSVEDARGTVQTFTYNDLKQISQISFSTVTGIQTFGSITYQYDAVGNQKYMLDENGNSTYTLDEFSRVTNETRHFDSLGTSKTKTYSYNDAGLLTGISDGSDSSLDVTYVYDDIGRLTKIDSGGYGGTTKIITDKKYRAFGAVSEVSYQNGLIASTGYNNRLQASSYSLEKTSTSQVLLGKTYDYGTSDNDGRLRESVDSNESKLNRRYVYDLAGRLSSAKAGETITESGPAYGKTDGPFEQTYSFNAFGNQVGQSERIWTDFPYCTNCPSTVSYNKVLVNNRNTDTGWVYDADGRLTRSEISSIVNTMEYNAAGLLWKVDSPDKDIEFQYDGNKKRVTRKEDGQVKNYYFRSNVLGRELMELSVTGATERSYVFDPNGTMIAKLENSTTTWLHHDESGVTSKETNAAGNSTSSVETDPLGNITNDSATYNYSGGATYNTNPTGYYNPGGAQGTCPTIFGVSMSCSIVNSMGIGHQSIQQSIAFHPWSLNSMFYEMGQNMSWRVSSQRGQSGRRSPIGERLSDSALFQMYRDAGFIWLGDFDVGRPAEGYGGYQERRLYRLPGSFSSVSTDCYRFAKKVEEIAEKHTKVRAFLTELADVFIGISSSENWEMFRNAGTSAGQKFTSQGWKPELYDAEDDNQARHFIGGLITGYNLGAGIGGWAFDYNEGSEADLAVNDISVPLGSNLTAPKEALVNGRTRRTYRPYDPGFRSLGQSIREAVCLNIQGGARRTP